MALCLAALPAPAQQMGKYSFEILPDGTPHYTQLLRWEPVENVLYYEVTVRDGTGREISTARVDDHELKLCLSPGEYGYRIVLYDVLRKPAITLPWQELTVLEAEIPRVTGSAPRAWFLEDGRPPFLTLSGSELVPGAIFLLKPADGSGGPVEGEELGREGESTVRVSFPSRTLAEGEYSLVVTNPGGLSVSLPRALVVRHMLPAPVVLEPTPGTVFGPDDLRGMTSLRFSWNPVAGASRYVFSLGRAGSATPLLRIESLTGTSCVLDDLRVLDRGDLHWTVEARGNDEECGEIPSVGPADSAFRIDLPRIAVPTFAGGNVFYGR